jgi:hypothetical protein
MRFPQIVLIVSCSVAGWLIGELIFESPNPATRSAASILVPTPSLILDEDAKDKDEVYVNSIQEKYVYHKGIGWEDKNGNVVKIIVFKPVSQP